MWTIVELSDATPVNTEVAGLKKKTWLRSSDGQDLLFKTHRPNSHESVAEVIASHLAPLVDVYALPYRLAVRRGESGCASRLVEGIQPGKQLLASVDGSYRVDAANYRNEGHTVDLVAGVLSGMSPSKDQQYLFGSACGQFLGYLLFDVWIVNTDRHHENWGYIETQSGRQLAPSYDHGSAFAWRETDDVLLKRLETSDIGFSVEHFLSRSKSALFGMDSTGGQRKLLLLEAARLIAFKCSASELNHWRLLFASISWNEVERIVAEVPTDILSDVRKRWLLRVLRVNQHRVLETLGC